MPLTATGRGSMHKINRKMVRSVYIPFADQHEIRGFCFLGVAFARAKICPQWRAT